ncbi:hypothetical protein J2P12_04440 [Candidatus Bathyarchaeota archaeon]|nr:hypothetical protein [Candidatus Bathyarchaeota archaeon]
MGETRSAISTMGGANSPMIRAKIVVFLQFAFIVLLFYALSAEYNSNAYQQSWIAANASWLQYLLNGYMAAALIGILIGGAFLLIVDILRNRDGKGKGGMRTGF